MGTGIYTKKEPKRKEFAIGWHIVQFDRRLRYDDGRYDVVGTKLRMQGNKEPNLCNQGMHASPTVFDAMEYMPNKRHNRGNILRCVLVEGNVTQHAKSIIGYDGNGNEWELHDDKFCGTHRTALFEIKLKSFIERVRKLAKKNKIDIELAYGLVERMLLKERLLINIS